MEIRGINGLVRKPPYICSSCRRKAQQARVQASGVKAQTRCITQEFFRKKEEAKQAWASKAQDIKAGRQENILSILERRGYINQIVGERKNLDRLLREKRVGVYVGVDPTAASMHVGHLLPLMALYWMYCHGFHTCSLLGGATAKIGDPSGRNTSRGEQQPSERKANMFKMHYQLKIMWENVENRVKHYGYQWEWAWRRELTNNNAWLNKLPAIEILKVLAPGVRLGTMLGRDYVKQRLDNGDGMSMAEFFYPLLQAWDWWHMYQTKDIQLQIGGSDQFGNILAGVDAINYVRKTYCNPSITESKTMNKSNRFYKTPMGFTVPLLTTASGEKFGKSAGNAIWLDQEMTSPFDLYQFFLRTADADVHRYLKLFTFEPLETLKQLMEEHEKDPSKRVAQHKLAREVLHIVHGHEIAAQAEKEHSLLFQSRSRPQIQSPEDQQDTSTRTNTATTPESNPDKKPADYTSQLNKTAPQTSAFNMPNPSTTLPMSLVYDTPISKVLYHAGLVASKSEGHRLCAKGGAYIGSSPGGTGTMSDQIDFSPCLNWQSTETAKYIIDGGLMLLRIGKWKIRVIKIVPDEEFEKQGLDVPGWREWKEEIASGTAKRENMEDGISEDLIDMKPWHKKKYEEKVPLHNNKDKGLVRKVGSLEGQTS